MPRLLLLIFLILSACLLATAADMPREGSIAPDFTLPSQQGEVALHDLRGHWVVLYFYPRDMTSGCTMEAHNFQRDQAQYGERNAVVLGVSVDSIDSHKQFCVKDGLQFKLLSDTDHHVTKEYGSLTNLGIVKYASRNTFLIDPEGRIVKVFTGVDPKSHSQQVLAALDQLQKNETTSK
jgi:thioredoxin-dependent peroxiredoxin